MSIIVLIYSIFSFYTHFACKHISVKFCDKKNETFRLTETTRLPEETTTELPSIVSSTVSVFEKNESQTVSYQVFNPFVKPVVNSVVKPVNPAKPVNPVVKPVERVRSDPDYEDDPAFEVIHFQLVFEFLMSHCRSDQVIFIFLKIHFLLASLT
jgi:hypothetical protein